MINKILRKNIFLKNATFYISATLFGQGLSFLTIPFFTRVLKPYEYGIVAIYMSLINFLFIFSGLNIKGALVRYYHEKNANMPEFLFNVFFVLFLYNIFFVGIMLYFKGYLSSFFNISEKVFSFVIIGTVGTVIIELYLSYLNTMEKSKKYAIISYYRSGIYVFLSVIGVLLLKENKYWGRIYANTGMLVILSVYSLYIFSKNITIKIKKKHIKYMLFFGVPLIFHSVSGFLLAFSDRLIINQIVGAKEAGFYSFAYNIAMIMNVFVMGFNKSWLPFFYREKRENNINKIKKQSKKYAIYIAVLMFFLGIFSVDIAKIMATDQYSDSFSIIPTMIIGIGFMFLYTLYANVSFYYKKTILISINTFIAAILNVSLNYWLIPLKGYYIAAYTTLFSYFVLFVLHYIVSRWIIKDRTFDIKTVLFPFMMSITMVYVFNKFSLFFKSVAVGVVVLIIVFNRNKIKW